MNSNRLFTTSVISTLIIVVFFMVAVLISVISYINWEKFPNIFFSDEILFAIKLSLLTATISSILSMIVAVPVAFALSRFRFSGKDIIDTLIDIPIILSPIAMGAVLLIFFNNTNFGGFIEKNIIQFTFEAPGIILAQFVVVFALAVRLLKSTFDSIDIRLENVIRTLGANKKQSIFYVTLPMARHGLIAAFVLTWARAIGEFGATLTLAGASTMKTETLPIAIHLSFAKADVQQALIVVLILLALAAVVLYTVRKLTRKVIL